MKEHLLSSKCSLRVTKRRRCTKWWKGGKGGLKCMCFKRSSVRLSGPRSKETHLVYGGKFLCVDGEMCWAGGPYYVSWSGAYLQGGYGGSDGRQKGFNRVKCWVLMSGCSGSTRGRAGFTGKRDQKQTTLRDKVFSSRGEREGRLKVTQPDR